MWSKPRYCGQLQNHVESRISAGELKNYHVRKICVSLRGPTIWRVMPINVWNDIVSWQSRRLNNSTKYQLHALMTTTSKKKKWNPWENCHKYALKLYWNAYSTLSISVLQSVLKWCRKEHKKDSGEERVTAKSKRMMTLVSRCSEKTPVALSSIASETPGKTRHGSQTLLSPQTEKYDRNGETRWMLTLIKLLRIEER